MSNESKVREDAYDAWTRTVGVSNAPGGNLAMSPLDAWRAAWQASRAAALEEAARAMHPEIRSMMSRGEAAAAIRALAAKEGL